MAFKYEGRSAESIKKEAAAASGSYDDYMKAGTQKFKPRDGDNAIRILPPGWEDKRPVEQGGWGDSWGVTLWVHGNIGVDRANYLCPQKMTGEPCAICDARQEVLDDKEEADALRPSKRTGVWLIDRYAEKDGPQFWSMPQQQIAGEILQRSIDRKTGAAVLIDHPDDGYDVLFRKTGVQRNTDYTAVEIDRDPSYLCENTKTQDKWLEFIVEHNLPSMFNFFTYEYLEKVVRGQASRKESDKDDRQEDRGGRGGRGRSDEKEDRGRSRGGREESSSRRSSREEEPDTAEKEDRGGRRTSREPEPEERSSRRGGDDDRGRGRGRDPEPQERSSRRGRDEDKDEPEAKEDRGGRRSSREEDDHPTSSADRAGTRSRDDGDAKSAGRGRTADKEDQDSEGEDSGRGSRERTRSRSDEKDEPATTRRSSRDVEPEDDKKDSGRGRGRGKADEDETDQAKEEIGKLKNRRGGR